MSVLHLLLCTKRNEKFSTVNKDCVAERGDLYIGKKVSMNYGFNFLSKTKYLNRKQIIYEIYIITCINQMTDVFDVK